MQYYQFDWLGKDWQKLKKQLVILSVSHSSCFSTENQLLVEDLRLFISVILSDINQRIVKDELGLWQEALPLFTNFDLLQKLINDGLKNTKGKDISFNQALGQNLKYFFEYARRELLALELGDSPARIKTWERLNRFSNKIAKNASFDELCSEEYFDYLLKAIKTQRAGDYNYPQKIDSIRQYFFKFSQDCKKLEIQIDGSELDSYSKLNISVAIGDDLFGSGEKETLQKCLLQLDKEDLELLDVAFGLEVSSAQYLSEQVYQQANGYTKRQYDEAKINALKNLSTLFDKQYYEVEQ